MCGILFYVTTGLTPEQVDAVRDVHVPKLRHRGPDGTNVRVGKTFLMAFHRLAIINPGPDGMQPFTSPTGTRHLVCNGEIYNYKRLARGAQPRSDVEVILQLAECSGIDDYVRRLDGDFAFVVCADDGTYEVARDHVGVRPLFYGTDRAGTPIAFASEAKALIGAPCIDEVHVFPPGTVYSGGVLRRYVCLPNARGNLRELLSAAVTKRVLHSDATQSDHLRWSRPQSGLQATAPCAHSEAVLRGTTCPASRRPVAVLCSGGVDSSVITTLAATQQRVHVFVMQYDSGLSEDAFYAAMLCKEHGLAHTVVKFGLPDVVAAIRDVVRVTETYDPNTIRASIPMYLLARHIAQNTDIKVVLSGEGADELFAGYSYFALAPSGDELKAETRRLVGNLHMFDLLRADRCFAAFGLEVRVPFLDQDVVRHVLGAAAAGDSEKKMLRDAFRDVESLVKARIIDRPKERFSDGCGFSYVPQLLNHVSECASHLKDKLSGEKRHYDLIFDELYPDSRYWIVDRTMPKWAAQGVVDDTLVF